MSSLSVKKPIKLKRFLLSRFCRYEYDQHLRSESRTSNTYGTAAHPNLYDREVLTFLPYQVNAHHFVIPYYVMTRNELVNLTPENFTIDFTGINAVGAAITAYDPLNGVSVSYCSAPQNERL
jgi:hypothetical protein